MKLKEIFAKTSYKKGTLLVLTYLYNIILTPLLFCQDNDSTHTFLLIKVISNLQVIPTSRNKSTQFSEDKNLNETPQCVTVNILNDNRVFIRISVLNL